jgi:hypothetical protein
MKRTEQLLLDLLRTKQPLDFRGMPSLFNSRDFVTLSKLSEKHLLKAEIFSKIMSLSDFQPWKESIRAEARHAVMGVTLRNSFMLGQIETIVKLFNSNKIDMILIKGPVLDATGLREIGDLDILVRENDLLRVKELLEKNEYTYTGNRENLLLSKEEKEDISLQQSWNCQYQFRHSTNDLLLEIHTNFFERSRTYDIDISTLLDGIGSFWQRASWSKKFACDVLKKEDSLLLLCMHNAIKRCPANNRFTLRNLVDINNVASDGIDWDDFTIRATNLKITPFVLFSLSLTEYYLGLRIPQRIIQKLDEHCTKWDRRLIRLHRKCVTSIDHVSPVYSNLYKILVPFVYNDSWTLRMKRVFFIDAIFPSRIRVAEIYGIDKNSPLLPVAYLLNPFRWLYLLVRTLVK